MGYIEDLRKVVGKRPLVLTGVGVIVINRDQKVLLQKNFDGFWGIPGGFMELGESAEEAGRREVFEETGILIGKLELVTVVSGKDDFRKLANGDKYYSVTIVYATKDIVGGKLAADGVETTEVQFFEMNALPKKISLGMTRIISKIENG
ncbi:NUDIX hydrolase [Sporosarcina sp. G11-34]|uniref:NUDIX hydrolase n=1 Tax=Sporosarcina sp. G11-34 TaxID=2849605 RepID=UPI0022A9A1AD|nr:NUDIX domain-containing protein [Sporosarcina sp. G11-34]MCZ2257882.1 NUDIX domain-containing protein [Sporosarcina sp. G11-34]